MNGDTVTIAVALITTHYLAFLFGQWWVFVRHEKKLQRLWLETAASALSRPSMLHVPPEIRIRESCGPESEARRN